MAEQKNQPHGRQQQPEGQFGRNVQQGGASNPDDRDAAAQNANPGFTVPQDESGHPAPRTSADVGDPAANPHNRQEIPGAASGDYRDGKLTRQGMENAIRQGRSVIHNGRVVSRLEHLPSEAELAKGDAQAEAQARENLLRQRQAIDAQIAQLGGGQAKTADQSNRGGNAPRQQ